MIQTGEVRNNRNIIQIDIELLVDMSSPDLLSDTLDIPLHLQLSQTTPNTSQLWEFISMDFVEWLLVSDSFMDILVVIDQLTK